MSKVRVVDVDLDEVVVDDFLAQSLVSQGDRTFPLGLKVRVVAVEAVGDQRSVVVEDLQALHRHGGDDAIGIGADDRVDEHLDGRRRVRRAIALTVDVLPIRCRQSCGHSAVLRVGVQRAHEPAVVAPRRHHEGVLGIEVVTEFLADLFGEFLGGDRGVGFRTLGLRALFE